jgi:MFS family permease
MAFLARFSGNREVLALSIARMGDAIGNSILIIVLPLLVTQLPSPFFPVPETVRVGLLIAFYGLVAAIIQPIAGILVDRVNRRKIFIQIGLVLMLVATLGFIIATTFADLLFFRVFQGFAFALTTPASLAIITIATAQSTRGGSMGTFNSARFLGFTIGPLIGGYLYTAFGPDLAFLTGGAFILLAIVLVQAWVKDEEEEEEARRTKERTQFRFFDRTLLSSGIGGLAFAVFMMASSFSMLVTLEPQFNIRLNETAFAFSIAFATLTATQVVLQIPLGRLSDRRGRKPFVIGGLLLIAPATALLGLVVTTSQLIGVRLIQGIATAAIAAPAFALAGDLSKGGSEGRQLSLITTGFGLGIALGPLIAGFLAVYAFELPFLIGGIFSLVAAWVVFRFVPETVQRQS